MDEYSIKQGISKAINVSVDDIWGIKRMGGLTNYNYKASIKGQDFAVRFPGQGTGYFIDRLNERINTFIASEIGLNPEIIYFNDNSGMKMARYVNDPETMSPEAAKVEENMELMACVLGTLHASGRRFNNDFDGFEAIDYYEEKLVNAGGKPFDGYGEVKAMVIALKERVGDLSKCSVACHLDALAENFIKSGDGKMYLVDWEYSGNYDPLWDVASVSVECEFSPQQEEMFTAKYFGRNATEEEKLRIKVHKVCQDICWSLWASVKVAQGDESLREYSVMRYNRGKERLINFYP